MAVAVDGPQSLVIYGINLNCYTICCDLKIKSELLLYLLSHLLGLAVADAQSAWLVVRAVGARHQLSEGSRPGEPSLKVKFFCCCIVELTLINTNLLLITYSFFYYRVSQQQTQKFKRVATAVPTPDFFLTVIQTSMPNQQTCLPPTSIWNTSTSKKSAISD